MIRITAVLLVVLTLLGASCSNDLEINAPWKETMVVFGLVSRQDSTHYIRIGKAFLGEGDALKFASVADSVYYDPEALQVRVEEYLNDNPNRSFNLQPITDIPKDPGLFSYPGQVLYSFNTPPGAPLIPDATYKLSVTNKKTGVILTGSTRILGNLNFDMPISTLNFYPQQNLNIKWKSVEGGALYEVLFRFLYREYHVNNPTDTVRKYVELNIGRLNLDFKGAFQNLNKLVNNLDIYRTLSLELDVPDPLDPVARIADSVLIRINVADEDLMTYILVNQPSNTIAQERPQFNNVENGIGLFATRGTFAKKFRIGDFTVDSLRSNLFTKNLNFDERP
jgi:hypothetical protein